MQKVCLKKLAGILCLLLVVIIGTSGCRTSNNSSGQEIFSSQNASNKEEVLPDQDGNPYSTHKIVDGETIVEYDYSEAYEKLDLSVYTEYGEFGEDGIMWVKKSDYSGIQYGYVNYNGVFVIPLTSDIEKPGEFKNGFASIIYNYDKVHCNCGFFNSQGDLLFEYKLYTKHNYDEHIEYINNEVITFDDIILTDFSSSYEDYMYLSNSSKFICISDTSYYKEFFSVSNDWIRMIGKREGTYPYVKFYNKKGELELQIDENSNENYTMIWYVDDFENGKSIVKFIGLDYN